MRILMTIVLASGIVLGVSSAFRHHRHWAAGGCGMHSHRGWHHSPSGSPEAAPKPAPAEPPQ